MARELKFIILDRDGVINEESAEYIKSSAEWRPIPGSLEAISLLSQAGYTIVVATNQSGVGRGYYTEEDLAEIHQKMIACAKAQGGVIDKVFYCPHRSDEHCSCRKPASGLFEQIAAAYKIDLSGVVSIGDSLRDIQAAEKLACKPILVLTGNGEETLKNNPELHGKIPVFPNLLTAAQTLLKERENV
ncbi:D D-heptose 1 7-bisphosphate phosphatase [Candidatus Rickettsiella viridis]|uniref:D,D-heptose 1,7-bisphosphate phosphatase n=1 Tax=Candidatus Rickettsiella viridis TaxID=676208 RepID=A0A2Z5UU32_9COXI|nr:D-glycero-beta-D-manno-heptose 1,7-bisphosphate 7-phosphatase [Candidatus Rickettsiella viridis]BBB14974.1 D D-heptose 1 7-bisphosphate phosphatase [Candidatus Rickettsiella viridis]